MSDTSAFGFGKFIPGFDFLQNLGKAGQGASAVPPFAHWVAPTVSVEEIDKRIEELKAVQFWLEQNNRALSATVQALQVQRMTLSTLQGMNVNLADLAQGFPFAGAAKAAADAATGQPLSNWPLPDQAATDSAPAAPVPPAADEPAAPPAAEAAPAAGMATAMQWWGALTQQFQQIAQQALQDPAQQQAVKQATQMGSDFAKVAVQTASDMVRQAVSQAMPAKAEAAPAAKTPAAKKTTRQPAPAAAARQRAPAAGKTATASKATKPAPRKSTAAQPAAKTKSAAARKAGAR
ncbi:PhaM family polyhydroxyalkanoate granule multifunctional regulatory protein [Comamonas aquatica]|uniref:PhaM family polyhydroxyalkanoate granule multifunctional regulatory protein n=1 Tax=Comamonas aquatica TaxID=225991 RepID=UPI003918919A